MKNIKGKSWDKIMSEGASELEYPCLHIDEDAMPEIEGWTVGEEYELKIRVKMTNKDEYKSGARTNARLEVIAYEDLTVKEDDPSDPRKPGSIYGYQKK